MKLKTISAIIFFALLAYGIYWVVNLIWLRPSDIDMFFYRTYMEMEGDQPERLAEADISVVDAFQPFDYSYADPGAKRERSHQSTYKRILNQLQDYDVRVQDPQQQLTYKMLEFELEKRKAASPFFYHEYLFAPGIGAHQKLIDYLAHNYPIRDRDEAEYYYEDLKKLPNHLKALTNSMKERVRQNMLPPRELMQASVDEVTAFLSVPPRKNMLYLSFARRAIRVNPTQLNEGEAVEWMDKIEWTLSTKVYPAYSRLLSYLRSTVEACPEGISVYQLENGEAYYAHRLKWIAETSLSPQELHDLGKAELTTLREMVRAEGNSIKRPLEGPMGLYFSSIPPNTLTTYGDSFPGIDRLLNDYRKVINDVRVKITGAIEQEPRNKLIQTTFLDSFAFEHGPYVTYYPQSLGAKEQIGQPVFIQRKGKLIFKLKDLKRYPNWPMRNTAYYHTYPGRHLQLSLQRENEDIPLLRRTIDYPAFGQGWALYATTLADELGFHQDPQGGLPRDTYSRLGYLQKQILHACMLVIDPGIHALGWKKEEAIQFLLDNAGIAESEAKWRVNRVILEPGKHCAPYLGQQKILDLRAQSKSRLGADFAIQDFHALLLKNGSLPLSVLEESVTRWAGGGEE
jgi:uncharacterized protein (DUF885 family)